MPCGQITISGALCKGSRTCVRQRRGFVWRAVPATCRSLGSFRCVDEVLAPVDQRTWERRPHRTDHPLVEPSPIDVGMIRQHVAGHLAEDRLGPSHGNASKADKVNGRSRGTAGSSTHASNTSTGATVRSAARDPRRRWSTPRGRRAWRIDAPGRRARRCVAGAIASHAARGEPQPVRIDHVDGVRIGA